MRLDKFTIKAQETIENAQKLCDQNNHHNRSHSPCGCFNF